MPSAQAEATRRRLTAEGRLRKDLATLRDGDRVVFPVAQAAPDARSFDFEARATRVRAYHDLLPPQVAAVAPRAFDTLGEIAVCKVAEDAWPHRNTIGAALLEFLPGCRAVFHDRGVVGETRVRDLERIAGSGGTTTDVSENGLRLRVDPAHAYFSPRLADERAREAALVRRGERFVDLFGGVGALAVLAAKRGASATCIDVNADACALARGNAAANRVTITVIEGDARDVAATLAPADRIAMNLPHGAASFVDVAARLAAPGALVHYHAIVAVTGLDDAMRRLVETFSLHGRGASVTHTRRVRDYSASDAHFVFDVEVR